MSQRQPASESIHPVAGVGMALAEGPLGWGDSCRLLGIEEAVLLLRGFDLFAGLDDNEIGQVARLAHECTWRRGSVLFQEREEARNFCLLMEGQVALEKEVRLGPNSPARQATVEYVQPGGALAWSSLVAPYQYTKTAVAAQDVRALCFDGQSMRDLMRRSPRLGQLIMGRVAQVIKSRLSRQSDMLLYFLSIVSHELRAPLAAVQNYLQVMLSGYAGPLTSDQETMLERSVLRLDEMSALISGVLDLARMHPEQLQQAMEPVDLSEVVVEAVEDVQIRLKQKEQSLVLDAPDEFPELVAAHGRLRQVLSNLLSNAIKFSPQGSTVSLSVRSQAQGVRFEVIDQGPGIPRDEMPHVFEAFYRVQGSAEIAGLGLGLSIVKRIVDAHNGRIWVESPYPPGSRDGSRFVVELPWDPCQQE